MRASSLIRSPRRLLLCAAVAAAVAAVPLSPAHGGSWGDDGSVSGRVTTPSGRPASGFEVRVYESTWRDGDDWWDSVDETWTGANGTWSVVVGDWGADPGRYHVRVSDPEQHYADTWYRRSRTAAGAAEVVFAPGVDRTGIDVRLLGWPQIELPGRKVRLRGPRVPRRAATAPLDPLEGYQGQATCRRGPRKGTRAVLALLFATYGRQESAGLNRACVKNSTSEHYDGRAIDWMTHSRIRAQADKGDSFTRWLTRTRRGELGAMARRLGVMYVIWRGQIWKQYQAAAGWQTYERCDRPKYRRSSWDSFCHRNHVHVSLTWNGARMQTSWWTGRPAPG